MEVDVFGQIAVFEIGMIDGGVKNCRFIFKSFEQFEDGLHYVYDQFIGGVKVDEIRIIGDFMEDVTQDGINQILAVKIQQDAFRSVMNELDTGDDTGADDLPF